MPTFALALKTVVLRPEDDVAIARHELPAGTVLEDAEGDITVRADVHAGHKVARRAVKAGDPVRRYGQIIGFATQNIAPGDHVHLHNLGFTTLQQDYEFSTDVRPVDFYPKEAMRTFDGYKRADGRVGTRNYVAIIS